MASEIRLTKDQWVKPFAIISPKIFKRQKEFFTVETEDEYKPLGWLDRSKLLCKFGNETYKVHEIDFEDDDSYLEPLVGDEDDCDPHIHTPPSPKKITSEIEKAFKEVQKPFDLVKTRIEGFKDERKIFQLSRCALPDSLCCKDHASMLLLFSLVINESDERLFKLWLKYESSVFMKKMEKMDLFTLEDFVQQWIEATEFNKTARAKKPEFLSEFKRYEKWSHVYPIDAIENIRAASKTKCVVSRGKCFFHAMDFASTFIVGSYEASLEFIYKETKRTDELCDIGKEFSSLKALIGFKSSSFAIHKPERPKIGLESLKPHIPPCHFVNYTDLTEKKQLKHDQRLATPFYIDIGYESAEVVGFVSNMLERGDPSAAKSRITEVKNMIKKVEEARSNNPNQRVSNSCEKVIQERKYDCKKCPFSHCSTSDLEDLLQKKMKINQAIVGKIVRSKDGPIERCRSLLQAQAEHEAPENEKMRIFTPSFFTPYGYVKTSIEMRQKNLQK